MPRFYLTVGFLIKGVLDYIYCGFPDFSLSGSSIGALKGCFLLLRDTHTAFTGHHAV